MYTMREAMPEKYRLLWRRCYSKTVLATKLEAQAAAAEASAHWRENYEAYQCRTCGGWHIGHHAD